MICISDLARAGRALGLSACLLTLGACASAALPSAMAVPPGAVPAVAATAPGYHQLRVAQVQGGSNTNPLWESKVSNADFQNALQSSLIAVGYQADDSSKANLQVLASIVDLQQPILGLDLTVVSRVRYTVTPVGGGAPVFDETIAASGTGRLSEALAAVERMRLANEASAKANITAFIQRLEETLKANPAP